MMTMMLVAALGAVPVEVVAQDTSVAAQDTPQWAIQLGLGVPSVGLANGVGGLSVGGLGGLSAGLPTAGLLVERALGQHWTVTLGVDGSALALDQGLTSVQLGAAPGLRWYASRALQGGWVGARVNVSGSTLSSRLDTPAGATDSASATVTVSPDLMVGWTFHWNNHFLLTVAGGPAVSWTRATASFNGETSTASHLSAGVRTSAALGLAF